MRNRVVLSWYKKGKTKNLKIKVDFVNGRVNLVTFPLKNEQNKGAVFHYYFPL